MEDITNTSGPRISFRDRAVASKVHSTVQVKVEDEEEFDDSIYNKLFANLSGTPQPTSRKREFEEGELEDVDIDFSKIQIPSAIKKTALAQKYAAKTIKKLYAHPPGWVRQLDQTNPTYNFTREQYHKAWEMAVEFSAGYLIERGYCSQEELKGILDSKKALIRHTHFLVKEEKAEDQLKRAKVELERLGNGEAIYEGQVKHMTNAAKRLAAMEGEDLLTIQERYNLSMPDKPKMDTRGPKARQKISDMNRKRLEEQNKFRIDDY